MVIINVKKKKHKNLCNFHRCYLEKGLRILKNILNEMCVKLNIAHKNDYNI